MKGHAGIVAVFRIPGELAFHVFAALDEFERNLIRERTVAGLKAAPTLHYAVREGLGRQCAPPSSL